MITHEDALAGAAAEERVVRALLRAIWPRPHLLIVAALSVAIFGLDWAARPLMWCAGVWLAAQFAFRGGPFGREVATVFGGVANGIMDRIAPLLNRLNNREGTRRSGPAPERPASRRLADAVHWLRDAGGFLIQVWWLIPVALFMLFAGNVLDRLRGRLEDIFTSREDALEQRDDALQEAEARKRAHGDVIFALRISERTQERLDRAVEAARQGQEEIDDVVDEANHHQVGERDFVTLDRVYRDTYERVWDNSDREAAGNLPSGGSDDLRASAATRA